MQAWRDAERLVSATKSGDVSAPSDTAGASSTSPLARDELETPCAPTPSLPADVRLSMVTPNSLGCSTSMLSLFSSGRDSCQGGEGGEVTPSRSRRAIPSPWRFFKAPWKKRGRFRPPWSVLPPAPYTTGRHGNTWEPCGTARDKLSSTRQGPRDDRDGSREVGPWLASPVLPCPQALTLSFHPLPSFSSVTTARPVVGTTFPSRTSSR